jgi:hypothetical protein
MLTRVHPPDLDRMPSRRAPVAVAAVYRRPDPCEPCLRRLVDEVLRQALVDDVDLSTLAE